MITKHKLKAYLQLEEIHEYASGSRERLINKSGLEPKDLETLSDILESIQMIKNGVASDHFKSKTLAVINLSCDNEVKEILIENINNKNIVENNNYAYSTVEELKATEKKIKKQETISRFLIGFLVGVLIFGIVNKGFGFFHIFLPVILMRVFYKQSQKQKNQLEEIQAAIRTKTIRI